MFELLVQLLNKIWILVHAILTFVLVYEFCLEQTGNSEKLYISAIDWWQENFSESLLNNFSNYSSINEFLFYNLDVNKLFQLWKQFYKLSRCLLYSDFFHWRISGRYFYSIQCFIIFKVRFVLYHSRKYDLFHFFVPYFQCLN